MVSCLSALNIMPSTQFMLNVWVHAVRVERVGQSESKPISLKAKGPAHRITTDLNIRNAPRSYRIVWCCVYCVVCVWLRYPLIANAHAQYCT